MMRLVTLLQLSINVMFWMYIVGTAHGNTVSPPWITLSGCFNLSSNNETSNIQKNEPTQCFKMCPVVQSVGLKNMSCICNPQYNSNDILINRRCNLSCPGKSEVSCGSDGVDNELMSVYRRDETLPVGNGSSSYGNGYVVVSGSINTYYASDYNTSLQYGHLCYNDFVPPGPNQCIFEKTLSTWEHAITECNGRSARPIVVSDVSKCQTGNAFDGTYWIGIYREKPDFTTSTTATSTSTTATSTSSTSSKATLISKPTTGSRPSHNSTIPVTQETSKVSSSDGKNVVVVAASVAVIVVAILVALASILICKKRKLLCFRERHK